MNILKRFFIFLLIFFNTAIIFYIAFYWQQQNNFTVQQDNLGSQNVSQLLDEPASAKSDIAPNIPLTASTQDEAATSDEVEPRIKLVNECNSLVECEQRLIIENDPSCQGEVQNALNLLKSDSADNYYYALKYIGSINCEEQGSGIYVWQDPPTVTLGKSTVGVGTVWLAGVLVHEAKHAELYREYLAQNPGASSVPENIYGGEASEQKSLDKQYRALTEIGADQSTLDYVKQVINDKYWEVDYKDRWW